MKYVVFARESDKFDDILKDPTIRKASKTRLSFSRHLILGIGDEDDQIETYLMLKYGDNIVGIDTLIPDRTPIPYKDYTPKHPKGKRFI